MNLFLFAFLIVFSLISLKVYASCPDYWYDCMSEDGLVLGQICGGSCGSACQACDTKPFRKCQEKVNDYSRQAHRTYEKCDESGWYARILISEDDYRERRKQAAREGYELKMEFMPKPPSIPNILSGVPNPPSQSCKELWNNQCKSNAECCSNNCVKQPDWSLGVCKPEGQNLDNSSDNKSCKELWNNQCKSNAECCSNNCVKQPEWLVGVCKP